jgi:hypothetical protein
MITQARKNLDLKSRELKELQRKKAEITRQKAESDGQKSGNVYADINASGKIQFKEFIKGSLDGLKKLDFNFDLNLDLNKDFKEFFKDFDKKLNTGFDNQKFEKTKNVSKSYPVDKDDKLRINSRYGKVTINTWEKNEIKVDVEIKVSGPSESRLQEALDRVHINESKQGNVISFETVFDPVNLSFRSSGGNNNREVNYTVYMPSSNALDIKHSYGSISLPDFNGPLNIQGSYGSLKTGNLTNPSNTISYKYGGVTIGNLKSGVLDVAYGSLNIVNSGKLDANISYSPIKIETISGDIDLNLRYSGGLKVGKVDPLVKKINIDASYSSVSLGFDPAANFSFDVTGNYSSFNYNKDKVNVISNESSNNKKSYIGKYGNGSDAQVTIRSNYGSVKFL